MAGAMLTRPYPLRPRVVVPAVTMMLLVPFYLVIAAVTDERTLYAPELALDRMMPVQPAWSVIYLSYLLSPFLPLLIMRQEEHIRRTFLAWLMGWSVGYVCFLVYPTIAPRTDEVSGTGFFVWFLQGIYDADPPRNCFPSLHVATVFVAALSCWHVHRGVGLAAGIWASLIAVSTVFTKQHYVADVISGIFLAGVAWAMFLRSCPRAITPEPDRRAAPVLLAGLLGLYGLFVACSWVAYQLGRAAWGGRVCRIAFSAGRGKLPRNHATNGLGRKIPEGRGVLEPGRAVAADEAVPGTPCGARAHLGAGQRPWTRGGAGGGIRARGRRPRHRADGRGGGPRALSPTGGAIHGRGCVCPADGAARRV